MNAELLMRCARSAPPIIALQIHATALHAAEAAPPGAAVSVGGVLQMLLGLAVVLGLVLGLAWVMKRYSGHIGGGAGAIKVIAGAAVGQRERVVLVEVAGTWLVVGVAPGRVSALHTMPRGELPPAPAAGSHPAPAFAEWLRRKVEQRHAR